MKAGGSFICPQRHEGSISLLRVSNIFPGILTIWTDHGMWCETHPNTIENVSGPIYNNPMIKTVDKLRAITVGQLVDDIYNDNYSHLEFMDNMGGDCDCNIHSALNVILEYWEA